jgi:hypothetical protein
MESEPGGLVRRSGSSGNPERNGSSRRRREWGSSAWPSTTALARSISFRLLVRDWSRSRSNACTFADGVTFHQNALGTLDQGSATERAAQVVEIAKAPEHDVDRALPVLDVGVGDVGKDAPFGCLPDERRVR